MRAGEGHIMRFPPWDSRQWRASWDYAQMKYSRCPDSTRARERESGGKRRKIQDTFVAVTSLGQRRGTQIKKKKGEKKSSNSIEKGTLDSNKYGQRKWTRGIAERVSLGLKATNYTCSLIHTTFQHFFSLWSLSTLYTRGQLNMHDTRAASPQGGTKYCLRSACHNNLSLRWIMQ